jgi:ABC-type nitrate/sulfonate/bicarbonate transport system ATPase subunit/ABC-type transporter Mla maintaining outer membrane lipid asymmetry permease subunit MlaE
MQQSTPSTTSSSSITSSSSPPLVSFRARSVGSKCPFGNSTVEFELRPGGLVCLSGKSGLGKTTLATVLTGLNHNLSTLRKTLDIEIEECEWDPSIPKGERCGVLFQQTTLLDELTIAGNLKVALQVYHQQNGDKTKEDYYKEIKQLLDVVGLDYERDASKRPTELSGGMGRRASLALQLAQHKRVIVLDEPFTGLDYDAAMSVARELVHLRTVKQTALVLISHEPHLTKVVMDPTNSTASDNVTITLHEPANNDATATSSSSTPTKPSLFGTTFWDRFRDRLMDYTFYSLPLIGMAFIACGLAISMLTADLLRRLDFNDQVLDLVDTQVRPLIKMLTGEEANTFQMMGVRFKVKSLLNQTVPPAKASIFAIGMTKLFVLEIGPLLTALLLCGRIGGSYAGKVGTLHATSQTKLLQTLGISPLAWTLWPSVFAALLAAPLLTFMGTAIALGLAGWVGPTYYGIGTTTQFWNDMKDSLLPLLRLKSFAPLWEEDEDGNYIRSLSDLLSSIYQEGSLDCSVTYRPRYTHSLLETLVEIATYPPIYHAVKAVVFISIILGVAEGVAQWWKPHLTPRGVPAVITLSVVFSGLLVILADWGFSQLWLLRH